MEFLSGRVCDQRRDVDAVTHAEAGEGEQVEQARDAGGERSGKEQRGEARGLLRSRQAKQHEDAIG